MTVVDAKICQPMNGYVMGTAIQLETVILYSGLLDAEPGVAVLVWTHQTDNLDEPFLLSYCKTHETLLLFHGSASVYEPLQKDDTNLVKGPSPFSTYGETQTQTEVLTSPAYVVGSLHEPFAFSSLSSCSALSATRVPAIPAGNPA